ncbi:MAG: molybdopterin-dependent oxidoreductase, partial [Parachlamydiaceae bacterium]
NTISIFPVGALTSQVYRFRARPWDNKHTNSTCTLCPVGCSTTFDSRDGEIMRTRPCENKSLNDIWLCDKGSFGYEFTDSPDRLKKPLIRRGGKLETADWEEALTLVASKMEQAKHTGKVAGLGGNPLTLEENYLFQKLIREGAGVNNVDHRVGMSIFSLAEEGISAGMEMPIGDCENLSYVVLFGIDLTEEFPVIWLRLKEAINRGAKVVFIGHFAPEMVNHLSQTVLHAPGAELEALRQHLPHITATAMKEKKSAFFVGRQYLETKHRSKILSELSKLRTSIPQSTLNLLEGRGNSIGARFAGMRPDLAPGNKPLSNPGLNAIQVFEKAASEGWDFLHIAGADAAAKLPSKLWKEARSKIGFLVVQDLFLTETAQQADVVLPTLSFVEKSGSFLTIEGRIQQLHPGKAIPDTLMSDGDIFAKIGKKLGLNLSVDLDFTHRFEKGWVKIIHTEKGENTDKIVVDDGVLKATFAPSLFDQGVRMQHNPHLLELAKKTHIRLNPFEAIKRGLKDGDTVALKCNGNAISVKVKTDERVALKTVVIPLGFAKVPVHELGAQLFNGMAVEI